MIVAGFKANDHGSGVAWREEKDGKPGVRWKKGIQDPDEVVALVEKLALPYVVHHRIASIGPKIPEMTHPFPCDKNASTDLEGWTNKAVLFHNGTWSEYRHKMYEAALLKGVKLPRGPFSDTRMMAWLFHLLGEGFLDDIGEKVILFKPDDIEIFGHSRGWACIEGVWCSNSGFTHRMDKKDDDKSSRLVTPLRQIVDNSKNEKAPQGGGRQQPGFRPGPSQVDYTGFGPQRQNQQTGPEGASASISTRVEHGVICVVENIGAAPKGRHALTSNPEFVRVVTNLTGQAPPRLHKSTSRAEIIGNPKRFRSSGRNGSIQAADVFGGVVDPGWAAGGGDAELVRRRRMASMGISPVIM